MELTKNQIDQLSSIPIKGVVDLKKRLDESKKTWEDIQRDLKVIGDKLGRDLPMRELKRERVYNINDGWINLITPDGVMDEDTFFTTATRFIRYQRAILKQFEDMVYGEWVDEPAKCMTHVAKMMANITMVSEFFGLPEAPSEISSLNLK